MSQKNIMKFYLIILITSIFFSNIINAQDIKYAKKVIKTLSSAKYQGRGYEKNGHELAAKFIESQLKKNKIQKFGKSYSQKFLLNSNTFSGKMSIIFGKEILEPAIDFVVKGYSASINAKLKTEIITPELINDSIEFAIFCEKIFSDKIIIIDTFGLKNNAFNKKYKEITQENTLNAPCIIEMSEKLPPFVPAQVIKPYIGFSIIKKPNRPLPDSVFISIESDLEINIESSNIAGTIKGEKDSFIVFTAHYDHIGKMGRDIFFPGANDNASGVAMVLALAKYFSKREYTPKYSIAFIFFSGEELGLLGSKYYTENPLFELSKIKYLFNLDMVGSGDKGIQIVNSSLYLDVYEILNTINSEKNYLPEIKKRGPAANSDHYFFHAKGVKSFFIYTLGEYKEYHNVYDNSTNLPLNKFVELMNLLIDFEQTN